MRIDSFVKAAAAECLYRSGAIALGRRLGSRGGGRRTPRGIVLMYHRVNDDRDPFFPSLPVSAFVKQLDYLRRHYRIESIKSVLEWCASGSGGRPPVALTIDDGYPDTYESMMPELRRRGLSATLFLSTAPVETGVPLWTDRLRHAIKHATARSLELGELGLGEVRLSTEAARLGVLRSLLKRLKGLGPSAVEQALRRIDEESRPEGPLPRTLSWDQVREMSSNGSFTVGAHTHHHYLLSSLADHELETEIRTSSELIEKRLNRKVSLFCYPNGRRGDYDSRSFPVLRSLGIRYAVSSETGFVDAACDPFEVPRLYTSETRLALFAARLCGLSPRRGGSSSRGGWNDVDPEHRLEAQHR